MNRVNLRRYLADLIAMAHHVGADGAESYLRELKRQHEQILGVKLMPLDLKAGVIDEMLEYTYGPEAWADAAEWAADGAFDRAEYEAHDG